MNPVIYGAIVPGKPHPLLAAQKCKSWGNIRNGFEQLGKKIQELDPDLLLIYSAQWFSVIGHQIQADPNPVWNHVDSEWHDLGTMKYDFKIDADFADLYQKTATQRGLHSRTVAYKGFPIDTGSVVALKLLNPHNKIPACIVSCNLYSDRSETLVLGKAARDAVENQEKELWPLQLLPFPIEYLLSGSIHRRIGYILKKTMNGISKFLSFLKKVVWRMSLNWQGSFPKKLMENRK